MALIQVTPELLEGKASEVTNIRNEHDSLMNQLKSLITSLNEIWKGTAQDAFVEKYQSMQSTFTQFSEMLEQYATLMKTAASDLRTTDETLKSKMSGGGLQ